MTLALTRSSKSFKVGANMTLAGRPFQRRTVDGKKDVLLALAGQPMERIIDNVLLVINDLVHHCGFVLKIP